MRWRWDPNWRRELEGSAGVRSILADAGDVVEKGAKRRCPVSTDGSGGNPPGHLRDSIGQTPGVDGHGPFVDVGTDVHYALAQELGAAPHVIRSHGPWPLRDKHGRVFGREVHHPGNPPSPYLRPALDDIAGHRF